MPVSYALRTSRVVPDRQTAAYRGSCSRSRAWASAATTQPTYPDSDLYAESGDADVVIGYIVAHG